MSADRVVGRHRELSRFDQVLRAAEAEGPQTVVVGGEAGVGKTRLLQHVADRAETAGWLALRTTCVELGPEGLPFAPVAAALRALVHWRGIDWLTAQLAEPEPLLRLLPELGPARPDQPSQARVYDLFGGLLRRLASERPLLLLIDDLQWADRSTRELVGLLVRTLHPARVLLTAGYRSDDLVRGHPLRPFLAELERQPRVHRLTLDGLSRAETADLWTAVRGHPPGWEALDQVYRSSGGNPFFIEELASSPDGMSTPESLQDLLAGRIERLAAPAGEVVRVAAVGGLAVSHRLLAATAGLAEPALLAALRTATAAGILQPDDAGYAFGHRMVRDAALRDLLPTERAKLHQTYAEALAADPQLVPTHRHAAELAFHWYGAGVEAQALPALLRAAAEAERLHAHAEQVQLLDRALRLAVPGADRPALFARAIASATWAGEDVEALDLIDRALSESDRATAPGHTASLLAQRGMVLQNLHRDGAQVAIEEALALLPAGDRSRDRAQVLDLAAAVLAMRNLPVQAGELATEAAAVAAEHADAVLEANALTTLGWTLNQAGRYADGLAALQTAERTARAAGDPVRLVRVYLNLADRARRLGEFPAMIAAAESGLTAAEPAGVSRTLGVLLLSLLGTAQLMLGRCDAAEQTSRLATERVPAGALGAGAHAARAELALLRGDFDQARDELALAGTLLGGPPDDFHPVLARLRAELALTAGQLDEAAALVAAPELADRIGPVDPWDGWRLLCTAARVVAADRLRVGTGDQARADRANIQAVQEAAARLPVDTPFYAACAAQVAAELAEQPHTWAPVTAAWEALGAPHPTAYAQLRDAETRLGAGEAATARQLLRTAAATARQLGAEPLRQEAELLARAARLTLDGSPPRPLPTDLAQFGLTEREVEVLRLVAAGQSNRQIGRELYISPKTVSVHVSNLLGKLGVASRGEAAALAHRLRLVADP